MTDPTIVKQLAFLSNRFEVTDELAMYISNRKLQEEAAFKIEEHYLSVKDKMLTEFEQLVYPEAKKYVWVVKNEIKTLKQAMHEGIDDVLGKYETSILSEIGRCLVFKYTRNDLITADEISRTLFTKPTALYLKIYEDFFSYVYEDINQINAMKKGLQERQKLVNDRGTSTYIGYGYGFKGTVNAAMGAAAINFGSSMIEGISDGLSSVFDSSVVRKCTEQGLERAKQDLIIMGKEQVKKLMEVCQEYLFKDMQTELDALGITPYRTFSQEEQAVIDLKNENYDEAFTEGDIDAERYVAHIFRTLNEEPYNKNHYYHLIQVAWMRKDKTAAESILKFADYLGLGLSIKHRWKLDSIAKLPQLKKMEENTLSQVRCKLSAMEGLYDSLVEGEIDRLRKKSKFLENLSQVRNNIMGYQRLIATGTGVGPVFIKSDRTVGFAGKPLLIQRRLLTVEHLKDIVAVDYDFDRIIALRSNGTVSYSGNENFKSSIKEWTDIVAVSAGGYGDYVALRRNGTVVHHKADYYKEIETWRDIIAISCGERCCIGLKADGTVVASGSFAYYKDDPNKVLIEKIVSSWTNIVAVSAGSDHVLGLKNDGTVVAGKSGKCNSKACDVADWQGIVAIAAGMNHSVGLRVDGTVVAVGDNDYGQCNVENWKNVVAISARWLNTVGLKSDGTMEAVGKNEDGRCNLLAYRLWG